MHLSRMKAIFSKNKMCVRFTALDALGFVRHGFSTRLGGVSQGIFSSMNLSIGRGDDEEFVAENFRRFCAEIEVREQDLVFSSQTHDTHIRVVDESDKGKGLRRKRDYDSVDGLLTNIPGVPLLTSYADCVPLFFVDPVKKAVGTAHAGWRGTVDKIGAKMIQRFCTVYGSDAEDIVACIGPSIGKCCFETGEEVYDRVRNMGMDFSAWVTEMNAQQRSPQPGNKKYMIDLWQINKDILLESGVKDENITVAEMCTKCHSDIFFSHRATNGKRGAMAAVIGIHQG